MAEHRRSDLQRLVFAYRPEGFQAIGGLHRIAQELVNWLAAQPSPPPLATLSRSSSGLLQNTLPCRQLQAGDHLVIVGCDSGWAYALAVATRMRGRPVSWLPSFHDPDHAIHRNKARLAQAVLKALQLLGITIYVQTEHERDLLRCPWRDHRCLLSGHGLPARIRKALDGVQHANSRCDRPIDLLFLGRPTRQKGWHQFLAIAQIAKLQCAAIVPTHPREIKNNISLHIQASDQEIEKLLKMSKIVLIPANYESFGIAQLEAVVAGCVVPILGFWPLWDQFSALQWQNLNLKETAHQCRLLCQHPRQRWELNEQQFIYLKQHAIRRAPIVPTLQP